MRIISLLTALVVVSSAHAEVPQTGHDLFHEYYQYWYNERGTHCCNETHCRPATAGEFRYRNGNWEVLMPSGWRVIKESDMVIDDGGLSPFGSICHSGDTLFCIDLPDPQM